MTERFEFETYDGAVYHTEVEMPRNAFENNETPDEQEVDITLGDEVVGSGTYNARTGVITGDISSVTGLTIGPEGGLIFGMKPKEEVSRQQDEMDVPYGRDPADRYRVRREGE